MKTEYRDHPLGTPGLTVRLADEAGDDRSAPLVLRLARRLARFFRRR